MKRYLIWEDEEAVRNAAANSSSIKEMLIALGQHPKSTTGYKNAHYWAAYYKIELPKYDRKRAAPPQPWQGWNKIPDEDFF